MKILRVKILDSFGLMENGISINLLNQDRDIIIDGHNNINVIYSELGNVFLLNLGAINYKELTDDKESKSSQVSLSDLLGQDVKTIEFK